MRTTHALALLTVGVALSQACSRAGTQRQAAPDEQSAMSAGGQAQARAEIAVEELAYSSGDTQLKGFLAYPKGGELRPGILVVHEWWGLNEYVRSRARMLAELGYVALAIDMYGEGKSSEHPADAKKYMMEVVSNREEGVRRFEAGRAALLKRPNVDSTKVAAIGYCFGGAVVLGAARRGVDLDLVASFHGNYATEVPLAKDAFAGKLFIAHGAADSFTPAAQVEAFKRELEQASARYEFVSYEGAKHGFTNPGATELGQKAGIDVAYDPTADAQSWSKLQELLAQAFAGS
jgi:dienelactone hydrolase